MSEPRTEAGRRLLAYLDGIGDSPLSGVSFPDAEDDILAIEAEATSGGVTTEHEPWCWRRHTGDCVDGPSEPTPEVSIQPPRSTV